MTVGNLKMLTQKEVAELLNTTKDNVSMLRRIGILPAIKTGRNYMFSQDVIKRFQEDYEGLDVSNLQEALASKHELEIKREHEYEMKEENVKTMRDVVSSKPIFGVTGG